MKFTPVRLSPTLRASCMPCIWEFGFSGWENSCACAAMSAARTMLRLGLSMPQPYQLRREPTGRTCRTRPASSSAKKASGSGWCRFLVGLLLAEIPDDAADHDHGDANAVADTHSPIVDP